jgi:hypothetical protein
MSTSEPELRRIARAQIDQGHLPCDTPAHTWGGQGEGKLCELCGQRIGPEEIEYEVQMMADRDLTCRFHWRCHAAWRAECAGR